MKKWMSAVLTVALLCLPTIGFAANKADQKAGYTKEIIFWAVDMSGAGEYPDSDLYGLKPDGTIHQITKDDWNNGFPSLSPDGTKLIFSYWDGLNIVDAADGENREVLPIKGVDPSWSPDGKMIAFVDYNDSYKVKIYNLETGEETLVYDPQEKYANVSNVQWSPKGNEILFNFNTHLWTINIDGTGLKQLTTTDANGRGTYSSDGSKIVYSVWNDDRTKHWIKIMNADGTNPVVVRTNEGESNYFYKPVFDPDNDQVIAYSKMAKSGNYELFTYDLKKKKEKQLTQSDSPFDPYGDVGKQPAVWGYVKDKE